MHEEESDEDWPLIHSGNNIAKQKKIHELLKLRASQSVNFDDFIVKSEVLLSEAICSNNFADRVFFLLFFKEFCSIVNHKFNR